MSINLSTARLTRASARHPWRVIALWALVLVASFGLISNLMPSATTTEAKVTSQTDSVVGNKLLEDRLRGPFHANEAVVVQSSAFSVDDAAFKSYVQDLHARIAALGPDVIQSSTSFYDSNDPNLVSADRKATIVPLVMAGSIDDAADGIKKVLAIVHDAPDGDQFQVRVSGFASIGHDFNSAAEKDLQRSEYGPLPVAFLILVLVFGAVVAALLPVVLAFFAIIVAVALVAVIGQEFRFSFFVTNMILMMGLAVGIDYCLFIISRYREERARGRSTIEALEVTGGTAGRTVLFSGMTVVFALAGLLIVPHTIFRSLSAGAIFVVLASVVASTTLLPAILSLLGDKVDRLRIPFIQHAQEQHDEQAAGGFWDRLSRVVMAHPVIGLVLAGTLLAAAAVPTLSLRIGFAGVNTLPDSFQSKQGFQIIERLFAGGQVYPADVVIDGDTSKPEIQAAVERLKANVSGDKLFGPSRFEANQNGDLGLLSIQMIADPNTREATHAIERLRNDYIPQAFQGVDAHVFVTGIAAGNLDFFNTTDTYTPVVFAFVLGLSFLLLMLVFRSIVVPLKAIVLNLLSAGAAYGLLVLVFQEGVLTGLLGFQKIDAIEAWLPLFLFSILFGLSMDYHVFLLSRIKERYDVSGNNAEAVAFGVRSTGRLITGAALIMVAVFAGFAMGDLVMFQEMGFGLGVAVLIDATIVRSVLVPASMRLLGRWNWYLPPVLNWLPHLGLESAEPAYVQSAVE